MDVNAEIYPVVIPGMSQKESIKDKQELTIQCIDIMQYVIDATRTKTLHFKRHEIIDDTLQKMKGNLQPYQKVCCPVYTWM